MSPVDLAIFAISISKQDRFPDPGFRLIRTILPHFPPVRDETPRTLRGLMAATNSKFCALSYLQKSGLDWQGLNLPIHGYRVGLNVTSGALAHSASLVGAFSSLMPEIDMKRYQRAGLNTVFPLEILVNRAILDSGVVAVMRNHWSAFGRVQIGQRIIDQPSRKPDQSELRFPDSVDIDSNVVLLVTGNLRPLTVDIPCDSIVISPGSDPAIGTDSLDCRLELGDPLHGSIEVVINAADSKVTTLEMGWCQMIQGTRILLDCHWGFVGFIFFRFLCRSFLSFGLFRSCGEWPCAFGGIGFLAPVEERCC